MGDMGGDLDLVEHTKCVRWARKNAQDERKEREESEEAFLLNFGR